MDDYESKTRGIPAAYRGAIDPANLNLRIILLTGATVGALLILAANLPWIFGPGPEPAPTQAPLQQAAPAPPPTPRPATATPGSVLPVDILAYDAPAGAVIGPVEAGRGYQVREVRPDGWAWLEVDGSGAIWTNAPEVTGGKDE